VDELGRQLGCGALMTGLERTFSAPYFLRQAASLEEIEAEVKAGGRTPRSFIPMERALPGVKTIKIKGIAQKLIGNGQIGHDLRGLLIQTFDPEVDQIVQIVSQESGHMLALIGLEPDKGFVVRRGIKVPPAIG